MAEINQKILDSMIVSDCVPSTISTMIVSRAQSVESVFLILCVAVFSAAGCGRETQEAGVFETPEFAARQKEMEEASDEMLSSFSVSGYGKGGKKQWDLAGKSADIMSEEIKLTDVNGKVYGEDMDMTIVADQGTLNRLDSNVHLEKNVLASTDDGATLETDYLDWDAQNQKLSSEAPVWIKRGLMQAQGKGILGQPALNLMRLKKDVTMKIFLQQATGDVAVEQGPTVITCDGALEVNYQDNLAVFHDNVKVKDRRGQIIADKMDVYFATDDQQAKQVEGLEGLGLDKVVAEGNVEIHHQGNISYSQNAVYDTKTGLLTLTGQPRLVIYSTEGFGRVIGSADKE